MTDLTTARAAIQDQSTTCRKCGGTGDANYDADEYYEDRDND